MIMVVSDARQSYARYLERGANFYSITNGAFAALLLMLAAVNEGLGSAFEAAFVDDQVRAVLGLPQVIRPIGIVPIRHCAERPQKVSRRPKEEIIHY